ARRVGAADGVLPAQGKRLREHARVERPAPAAGPDEGATRTDRPRLVPRPGGVRPAPRRVPARPLARLVAAECPRLPGLRDAHPVAPRLRAVAADAHRAPRARAVARAVVERPVAGLPRTRLEPRPGAVRDRDRDHRQDPAQAAVEAA